MEDITVETILRLGAGGRGRESIPDRENSRNILGHFVSPLTVPNEGACSMSFLPLADH